MFFLLIATIQAAFGCCFPFNTNEELVTMLREKPQVYNAYVCGFIDTLNLDEIDEWWKNPAVETSCTYAKRQHGLAGADLSGLDLRTVVLGGMDLSNADLSGANLEEAHIGESSLHGANLQGVNLRNAYLKEIDGMGTNFRGADLTGASISRSLLRHADLRDANLTNARFWGTDLSHANVRGSLMVNIDLLGTRGLAKLVGKPKELDDDNRLFLNAYQAYEKAIKARKDVPNEQRSNE